MSSGGVSAALKREPTPHPQDIRLNPLRGFLPTPVAISHAGRGASRNAGATVLGGEIKGEASAEGRRRRTFAPTGIRARAHPLADARFPLRRRKTFLFDFFTPSVGQYPFSFPDRRRSEDRSVGQECVRTSRDRWPPSQ